MLLALLLVIGVAGQLRWGFADDWVDQAKDWAGIGTSDAPDPQREPEQVAPPEGIELPEQPAPSPVLRPLTAQRSGQVDPAKVQAALSTGKGLGDGRFGRHLVVAVGDLSGGGPVFDSGNGAFTPASTTKLFTSAAALEALGPERRFATTVVRDSPRRIVLVGGGDPYLSSKPVKDPEVYPQRADVVTLARRTASQLRADGTTRVRLGYDAGLFPDDGTNPQWEPDYIPDDVVSPIRALWVDRGDDASGYGNVSDPSATAAQVFADALRRSGIKVTGVPTEVDARRDADEVARVESPTVAEIVEHLLDVSDNETAEVMARQVGVQVADDGSVTGGPTAVLTTLSDLGVDTGQDRLFDGSGLSRHNRLTSRSMLQLLQLAGSEQHPELRSLLTGMPVAGFTGSLTDRFDSGNQDALGRVRAKTGTLTGVHGLAGTATDLDGNTMVFVAVADRVPRKNDLAQLKARVAVDELASRLGGCHCSR